MEIRCKVCGIIFKSKLARRAYCSANCRYKAKLSNLRRNRKINKESMKKTINAFAILTHKKKDIDLMYIPLERPPGCLYPLAIFPTERDAENMLMGKDERIIKCKISF